MSSVVAATAEAFRRAYVAYANGHKHGCANWASDAFFEPGTFAETFRMIECILNAPDLSPAGLGFLAAGPVENLIGMELLDTIEGNAGVRARWVPLLRGTFWSSEPPAVRRRLRVLLGLPPEPG